MLNDWLGEGALTGLQTLSFLEWTSLVCILLILGAITAFFAIPLAISVVKSEFNKIRIRRAYYAQVKRDRQARQAAEAARTDSE
jgi:hypothetical protein